MNLIKRQNPVFTSLIDDLFINQDWNHISATLPAANIIEADDHFNIDLAAPGKKKSDFTIGDDVEGLGGFILESKDGSIVLDYRFDSRLDEAWKENIREVNNILFGN